MFSFFVPRHKQHLVGSIRDFQCFGWPRRIQKSRRRAHGWRGHWRLKARRPTGALGNANFTMGCGKFTEPLMTTWQGSLFNVVHIHISAIFFCLWPLMSFEWPIAVSRLITVWMRLRYYEIADVSAWMCLQVHKNEHPDSRETVQQYNNGNTMSYHIVSYHIQFQVGSEEVSIWTNVSPRGIGTGSTCCEFASPEALNVSRLREDLKVATLGPGTGVSFQHPPYGDSLRWHERCVLEDLEVPLGNHCQNLLQAICPTAISLFGDPFNATSCNLWASKYSWSLEENWLSRFRAGLWRENPFTFWQSNTASEKILKLNDLCIYICMF